MKIIDKIICIALAFIGLFGLFCSGMFIGVIVEGTCGCCVVPWELWAGVIMGLLLAVGGIWASFEHLMASADSEKH